MKCASRGRCPAYASLKIKELSALFPVAQQRFWPRSVDSCGLLGFRSSGPNGVLMPTFYTLISVTLSLTIPDLTLTIPSWHWSTSVTCASGTEQPDKVAEPEEIIGLTSTRTAGEVAVSVFKGHTEVAVSPAEEVTPCVCALLDTWIPSFSIKDPPGLLWASSPVLPGSSWAWQGHAAFAGVVLQLLFQLSLSCSELGLCLSTQGEEDLTPWSWEVLFPSTSLVQACFLSLW